MKKRKGKGKMEKQQDGILEETMNPEEQNGENDQKQDPAAGAPAEEAAAPEDPAQKAIDDANAKAAEYLQLAQRVQADFENFRRRNENVRADAYAEGRKDVAAVMLPVLDNLERAVEAAAGSQDEALKSGIEMVLKQMTEAYGKLDVKPISRLGEKFDPNLENAILQGTEDEGEPGTVCQVLQKGYMIGDKVLRHAMVKVVPE